VSEAATLAQARAALAARPDWILLDLMLPDGNGIDLLHDLPALPHRPCICVITGCGRDLQEQARAAGAAHVLVKPVDIDALLATLLPESAHPAPLGTISKP
jgi:DNA-binding response OmpR family regulator